MSALHQDIFEFYKQLRVRLIGKGYIELRPVEPLDTAFLKRGLLNFGYLVAVKDAGNTTDTPKVIFQRTKDWFDRTMGRNATGVLLFVYSQPLATTVEDIQKGFYTGHASVGGGVYDLFTGKHWLSHYNMEQDIFG